MVMLNVHLDATGKVAKVDVDRANTTAAGDLQAAAVDAAQGWKFKPGEKDGRPVGGVVRIPVNFFLHAVNPPSSSGAIAPSVDIAYKNANPPRYPIEAMEKREQGTVMLDVTVDANGNVANVAVDPKGTNAAAVLQSAAIAAASKWKFIPGVKGGRPVGGAVEVPVNFAIAMPCPAGFNAIGRAEGAYSCIATPSAASTTPKKCLDRFQYKQGKGNSFECIAKPSTAQSP